MPKKVNAQRQLVHLLRTEAYKNYVVLTKGRTNHFSTMNLTNNRQIMVVLCAHLVLPSGESECLHHVVHPYKKMSSSCDLEPLTYDLDL